VNADSTGCQVIHGDWYGSFLMTIRRGLEWRRVREARARGEEAVAEAQDLPERGYVLYSLLQASDMSGRVSHGAAEGATGQSSPPDTR